MKNLLVAYFSASGVTRGVAEKLAAAAQAELHEIRPAALYTAADLDYTNKASRSTLEMQDLNSRPALAAEELDTAKYDVIFLGFPIWWGREPSIVDTFVEAHDLTGKRVIPFFTSGGGGFNNRTQLEKLVPGLEAHKALWSGVTEEELTAWLSELSL